MAMGPNVLFSAEPTSLENSLMYNIYLLFSLSSRLMGTSLASSYGSLIETEQIWFVRYWLNKPIQKFR